VNESSADDVDAIFVSPHYDDVALSCGGTLALEARHGHALVVTVFAGDQPEALNPFAEFQHRRWGHAGDAVDERRREDSAAMAVLGCDYRWLEFPDAIYRDNLYLTDEELFGPVKPEDEPVTEAIADALLSIATKTQPKIVYLPLAVGNHVDHQICTELGLRLVAGGATVLYFEDFPYAATPGAVEERIATFGPRLTPTIVSIEETIEKRLTAIKCYASQLATIFRHYGDPETVVREYARSLGSDSYAERFWKLRAS
jgi:LmbE family N-acetylglucosaminyl deacetylase